MSPVTLTDIENAMRGAWAADTCSPDDLARSGWHSDNPAWGHCDVTALVVNDVLGGNLVLGEVHHGESQQGFHWWNRLTTGFEIDLTRQQFTRGEIVTPGRIVQRPPGRLPRRWDAYQLFRRRFLDHLGLPPTSADEGDDN